MKRPVLAAVLVAALVAILAPVRGWTQEQESIPNEDYLGELYLFELPEVVVVYPAGPEEDIATNRASAEARAAFLSKTHGVTTSVVADDALGPEQRKKHLLILGWGNRVLRDTGLPLPYSHSPEGTSFLGIEERDPDVDLMFFTISPFDPDRAIVFWSRIDPDRDRMLTLPAVGSDWAMYRDFRILRQGMFVRPHVWPPKRQEAAEKDHSRDLRKAAAGVTVKAAGRYDIGYEVARIDAAEFEAIAEARQAAFARAAELLGSPPEGYRIHLRVYEDEAAKEKETGFPDPAHSIPAAHELHMTRRAARSPSPHEEIHLLARVMIGPCRSTTLYEGLAIAEEKAYRGVDLGVHAATMLDNGTFPDLADLLDEETARAMPGNQRYPAAALLVGWIRETAGPDGLRKAYTLPEGSLTALGRALGKAPGALTKAFREWVEKRGKERSTDLALLKIQSEAQERLSAGDYAGVASAMKRALALRPDDLQSLFNLASAEMRTREFGAAEEHLKRVLSLATQPKDARFLSFGHYQLGRLYDVQSRREDALAEYRKVLELPDVSDVHRLAGEAIASPATPESLQ